mmetsp:Transcript_97285/g.274254  ORF Transcript_97285/g.274254 Transcript_97285/m.274254 type:complete len:320 (+) Transcript_97285:320-1279(+)
MWAQARGEHASAPRPPSGLQFLAAPGHDLHVVHRVQGLLLTGVRDLGHRRHLPVRGRAQAAVVAIAHREDRAVAPDGAVLLRDLHVLVEVDPAAAARALVAQCLRRHEVVGGLDADADVLHVRLVRHLNLLPEVVALGVVLAIVELLDADGVHVRGAVVGGAVGQRAQAAGQRVDDGELHVGEEVLDLRGPLHTDEAGANDEASGLPLVQVVQLVELLQHVPAAALDEALVDVRPVADLPGLLVNRGEPQRLAHGLEGAEVAARADDAVVEADLVRGAREDGLDLRVLLSAVQRLHLAPDELHTHGALQHRLQREGQRI